MKLLGRFAKSSMRLELDEDGAEPEAGGSVQVERKDDSIWPRAGREWAEHMRLDKYLKVSRLIKRRTVANEACDAGRILVNGKAARASYDVKEGDVLTINLGAREVRAQVVSVQEVVAKNDAALLYKLLP